MCRKAQVTLNEFKKTDEKIRAIKEANPNGTRPKNQNNQTNNQPPKQEHPKRIRLISSPDVRMKVKIRRSTTGVKRGDEFKALAALSTGRPSRSRHPVCEATSFATIPPSRGAHWESRRMNHQLPRRFLRRVPPPARLLDWCLIAAGGDKPCQVLVGFLFGLLRVFCFCFCLMAGSFLFFSSPR